MIEEIKPRSNSAREGFNPKVDIREDEDQGVKLSEIIELLVAAGYFRARIKGLSPFDKIVGGMTWCIETCNFDVDVDLLFNENLTIGQKISLTERIVRVLRSMKCPHRLEPHQVQGLDAIHIFPVIQWLVKKALETRAEFGDETRNFSSWQFKQYYAIPEEQKIAETKSAAIKTLINVKTAYGPKRRWKKKIGLFQESENVRVQTTLLEYDRLMGNLSKTDVRFGNDEADAGTDAVQEQQMAEVEQLMKNLDVAEAVEGKLSAACVGNIVSARAQEIADSSYHFTELQQQMADEILGEGASSQLRLLTSLEEQKSSRAKELQTVEAQYQQEITKLTELGSQLKEIQQKKNILTQEIEDLGSVDTPENKMLLEQLSKLVSENEAAKKKETEFKDSCRKKSEKIKKEISSLESKIQEAEESDELKDRFNTEKEKYNKMRLQLAKKTRQVESLRRLIDDVPGRAELSQYQKRFIELYNQVASTHRETQQFYNMYNTLADSKTYMEKELSLLNSMVDNMEPAFANAANLEQYIQQLENIVEGIRQNKIKLDRRCTEEKAERHGLMEELNRLQELNRQYAKTVHLLSQDIRKNEALYEKIAQIRGQ